MQFDRIRAMRIGLRLWVGVVAVLAFALSAVASTPSAPRSQKADAILILKKDHVMQLLNGDKVIRTYKVALGQGGLAAKEREGDARTPEGHYTIDAKYEHSAYHKALHVSYPDPEDRKRAARMHVPPGGAMHSRNRRRDR
jgi:murein L,D-transpeptidase YafK